MSRLPRSLLRGPISRRGRRVLEGSLLILLGAGCSGRDASVNQPDFTIKAPDLALIELCPPKPPPPGTISPAEMKKRDQDLMDSRQREYQKQVAERARLKEQGRKEAEQICDAVIKPMIGQPAASPAPPRVEELWRRLERSEDQLVTCAALSAANPSLCNRSARSAPACRLRLALLRRPDGKNPPAPGAVADLAFEMCKHDAPKANCAGLRDAVRKNNPSACPKSPDVAALCAVIAWRDPGKCPPAKPGTAGEGCADQAKWAAALAQGKVDGLWPGDSTADESLANALAGNPGSCNGLIDAVRKKCMTLATPPLPDEPHPPENVPGAAPAEPKKEGATPKPGPGLGGAPAAPGTPEPKPAPR